MITADQPTCFPNELLVAVSSKQDGTVLDRAVGLHSPEVSTNRTRFCEQVGISYGDVVFQRIVYGKEQRYDEIAIVTAKDTTLYKSEVAADALFTNQPGVGLLLPVADCVATVVYDPIKRYVALLHLGRHSSITRLIQKTIDVFRQHGSNPAHLLVWMSPNVHQSHYRMDYFSLANTPEWKPFCEKREDGYYVDLQGHNKQAFIAAGLKVSNIHTSPHNTATHSDYYSHSHGDTTGRFAVVAMIRA